MTILSDMPVEVLALIALGYEAIELWKCGDKRIMSKLASGGAVSLKLQDEKFDSTSRFPRCLVEFAFLRELSISRGDHHLMDAEDFGKCLQQLSPSLLKLRIESAGSMAAFVAPVATATFFDDEEVPADDQDDNHPGSTIWNVKRTFPRLQSLILQGGPPKWNDLDFLQLPSTLTHLKLPFVDHFRPLAFQSLPTSLTSLYLNPKQYSSLPTELAAALPRTLLAIDSTAYIFNVDNISALPTSLTSLVPGQRVDWSPSFAAVWPPLATVLEVNIPPHVGPSLGDDLSLPKHLTTLEFGGKSDSEYLVLKTDTLAALPRTLTDLQIWPASIDWAGVVPGTLPSALTRLAIPTTSLFTSQAASVLPRSIKHLWFLRNPRLRSPTIERDAALDELDHAIFPILPPAISELYIETMRNTGDGVLEGLPNGLRCLTIACPIMPSNLALLPRGLTELSLRSTYVCLKDQVEQLPRTLTTLKLDAPIHADSVGALPSALADLTLGEILPIGADVSTSKIVRLRVREETDAPAHDEYSDSDEEWDQTDGYEYSDYRGFSVFGDSDSDDDESTEVKRRKRILRNVCVSAWPPNLVFFHLTENFNYSKEFFASLPDTVTTFLAQTMPAVALTALPKNLQFLGCRIPDAITAQHLAALPRSLTHFSGQERNFSLPEDVSHLLPPHINPTAKSLRKFAAARVKKARMLQQGNLPLLDPRVAQRFARHSTEM